jgi:hypothetical protein
MPKTLKNRPSLSGIDTTFHGLQHWYQSKFEQLGWMILAKHQGMMDKVMTYENGVKRLHAAIIYKIKLMRDKDKKADLVIMKSNVEVLLEHIARDFA